MLATDPGPDPESGASLLMSRRQIVQAAGVALLICALPAAAGMGSRDSSLPPVFAPAVFMIDERFDEADDFGRECRRQGLDIIAMQGDLTPLWMGDLEMRWRKQPAVLAGVTSASTLACLEILANRERMRVTFKSDQPLCGARELLAMMARCPNEAKTAQQSLSMRNPTMGTLPRETPIAWVIAPVQGIATI